MLVNGLLISLLPRKNYVYNLKSRTIKVICLDKFSITIQKGNSLGINVKKAKFQKNSQKRQKGRQQAFA